MSESDFQQIKDWNLKSAGYISVNKLCLNPTSNKSRIETEMHLDALHGPIRLNPTSNKSRIETERQIQDALATSRSESDFQQIKDWNKNCAGCWLRWISVWIRLPTNQGLKLSNAIGAESRLAMSESDFQQIKDWNSNKLVTPF